MTDEGLVAHESRKPLNVGAGVYPAKVTAIEDIEGQFGRQWQFTFQLDDHPDEEPVAWASAKLGTKTKLYGWATALLGHAPVLGERVMRENLIGLSCRLQIGEKPGEEGEPMSYVSDVLAPVKTAKAKPLEPAPEPPEEVPPDVTCWCGEPLSAYAPNGVPLCKKHHQELQRIE